MPKMSFSAICADQSSDHKVLSLVATATQILQFASIDRIGRDKDGKLSGFQRPQIADHIREIKNYLNKPNAVLPNPIVVAFITGVDVQRNGGNVCTVDIEMSTGPLGLVVDGQQRLTALSEMEKDMPVFVSLLICRDEAELRKQFVLINSTRPLPKSLIYELLPSVEGLSERLMGRSLAAHLTARLNFDADSPLKGTIYQHTNPSGIIRDTSIQRVIMNSLNDGVMRDIMRKPDGEDLSIELLKEFFWAVRRVFSSSWDGHTPRTSRLVHGAGVVAMGYVMETLALLDNARTREDFSKGLACLAFDSAWTSGEWNFSRDDIRHWKAIQNLHKDIVTLAHHLISRVRADMRVRRGLHPARVPLFETAS